MTPKERAAMQLALEALEELHYSSGTVVAARMYESATVALREALAEQVEQEPVAWGVFEGNLHDMFFEQSEAEYIAKCKGGDAVVEPLYAAPVRTKDLTVSELDAIIEKYYDDEIDLKAMILDVIAADREKNK